MPVVVNIPATPCGATPEPAKPMEHIAIAKTETTMDPNMDNMMLAFEVSMFEIRKANGSGYGGYQTARA
jgi:hypothetical protein